jgi:hypothetical protein
MYSSTLRPLPPGFRPLEDDLVPEARETRHPDRDAQIALPGRGPIAADTYESTADTPTGRIESAQPFLHARRLHQRSGTDISFFLFLMPPSAATIRKQRSNTDEMEKIPPGLSTIFSPFFENNTRCNV